MAKEHVNYPIAEEKPEHYRYIKNFRTQPCRPFVEHRCDKSKPYTCFDYHYDNQKRRIPKRDTKDGTFNYCATEICAEYDPVKGVCPKGSGCRLLHKTSGDTERLYHLRYYKTQKCQHPLDAKGHCTRNGPHCAFAHGDADLRSPVYDAAELRSLEQRKSVSVAGTTAAAVPTASSGAMPTTATATGALGSSAVASTAVNGVTDWRSPAVVLAQFKTEPCANSIRSCVGPTCPKYHNARDRRRSPYNYSYRPQPCSDVKVADSWKDPSSCHKGDGCIYSHTRYEQQFHPEIYKSAICVDHNAGRTCPRADFCAFAHGDGERTAVDRVRSQVVTTVAIAPTSQLRSATPATAAVLPPGATKQPQAVVAPPPGLPPIQSSAVSSSSLSQLLAGSKATPYNSGQLPGQASDVRIGITSGSPAAVSVPSEIVGRSTWREMDSAILTQSIPTASAAGLSAVKDELMKPEELCRLIDADITIDALEQKRRKRIVLNLATNSSVVSYKLYNDAVLGNTGRTGGYMDASASGAAMPNLGDLLLTGRKLESNNVFNESIAKEKMFALANGIERPEIQMDEKVQQALLESQLILNQTKLNGLSSSDLRTIRKQLQRHVNIVDEIIEQKLSAS